MELQNLPEGVGAEFLLSHLPKDFFRLSFQGLHHRNACHDIAETVPLSGGRVDITLARKSLYDNLPEYLFHPTDRFDGLLGKENKDEFDQELDKQDEEKENALTFFAPVDLALQQVRMDVWRQTECYGVRNIPLIEMLADRLTDEQRNNRFIRRMAGFLPQVRWIRGDRTALSLMLRKVFASEQISLTPTEQTQEFTDPEPRFADTLGSPLNEMYVGNIWQEPVFCYDIHYWDDDACDEHFLLFVDEVEQCRLFVRDYFLAVGDELVFRILTDAAPLRLSDEESWNYLNYNTNI